TALILKPCGSSSWCVRQNNPLPRLRSPPHRPRKSRWCRAASRNSRLKKSNASSAARKSKCSFRLVTLRSKLPNPPAPERKSAGTIPALARWNISSDVCVSSSEFGPICLGGWKMRIRTRAFPAMLALLLSLAATVAAKPTLASDEGHFDRTLTVTGAVDLDVQTGSGEITVHTGDSSKLKIPGPLHPNHGWFGVDAKQRIHEIEANPPIEQHGNTIRVGHIENHDSKNNISISYELIVPVQTKLHSESGSGDQVVGGISGPADASSGSGRVRLSDIGGETHARTGSGEIELNGIHGAARATAGSGSIRAIGIAGALTASSGSGSVKFE